MVLVLGPHSQAAGPLRVPQIKLEAEQLVVCCQDLQLPEAVQVRIMLVFPVSQATAPRVAQPPPVTGCAAVAGHAQAAEGAAPLQVVGLTQSTGGFWKVQACASTVQAMVPVLVELHAVPTPAEQKGSTTQVQAAAGAAPVQAW